MEVSGVRSSCATDLIASYRAASRIRSLRGRDLVFPFPTAVGGAGGTHTFFIPTAARLAPERADECLRKHPDFGERDMLKLLNANVAKVLASLALVGAAGSIAGLGTYASFTSSTSANHVASSGTVSIALGAAGAATNRLSVGASGLVPGDTIQRSVDLVDNGSENLAAVTLTTSASPSSLLDTDATNGLQITIDKCSVAWTEAGPPYVYTCSGATSSVLASRPVIGSNLALANLASLTAGATDHLRLTLTLPSTAGNALQGQSSTITYAFTGVQRAGGNK
jgi:spore coat-associated protein N